MATSRSRQSEPPSKRRASLVFTAGGAVLTGWLALSGETFKFTNGSEFGLFLTSGMIFASMALALGTIYLAARGFRARKRPVIVDIRDHRASAESANETKGKAA